MLLSFCWFLFLTWVILALDLQLLSGANTCFQSHNLALNFLGGPWVLSCPSGPNAFIRLFSSCSTSVAMRPTRVHPTQVPFLPTFSGTFITNNYSWVKTQFSKWSKHKQREVIVNKRNWNVTAHWLTLVVNSASISPNQHSSGPAPSGVPGTFSMKVSLSDFSGNSWRLQTRAYSLEDTSSLSPSLLMSACERAQWQTLTLSTTSHIPWNCLTPPDEFCWQRKRGWSRRSP